MPFDDRFLGLVEYRLADIDGHVPNRGAACRVRFQQVVRLDGVARPQLDQGDGSRDPTDPLGVLLEDSRFRPGEIVLGLPRDLLEQLAAPIVVEETAVQPGRRVGQAERYGLRKLPHIVGGVTRIDDDTFHIRIRGVGRHGCYDFGVTQAAAGDRYSLVRSTQGRAVR